MTDTTYRFSALLGGQQHVAVAYQVTSSGADLVGFDLPDIPDRVWLPGSALTVVMNEPPNRSVVRVGDQIFARFDLIWWQPGTSRSATWDEICGLGAPVLLVPAAPLVSVEFPWVYEDQTDGAKLFLDDAGSTPKFGFIKTPSQGVDLTPASLRALSNAALVLAAQLDGAA